MDVGTKSYDPSGNMTFDNATGNTYLYDGEGRICAVSSTPVPGFTTMTGYVYDAGGNRVAKGTITSMSCDPSVNGIATANNETDYVLGPGGEQVTELAQDSNGTMNWQRTYVYGAGGLIATYDPDPDNPSQPLPSFRLTDWLGTLRATTDAYGVAQGTCTGLPFGDGVNCSGDIPDNHHFTGKERDPETGGLNGNDYFGARYYGSGMGRFLTPDWSAQEEPVPYAKMDDPQSLNLYAYVMNNPMTRIDPDGHGCHKFLGVTFCWGDPPPLPPPPPTPKPPSAPPIALVKTSISGGTTSFTVSTHDKTTTTTWDSLTKVDSKYLKSHPDVGKPLITDIKGVELGAGIADTRKYGPSGAAISTDDPHGQWLHGGGGSADSQEPNQTLIPTYGCTRMHNQDAITLGKDVKQFMQDHPESGPAVWERTQ